MFAFTEEHGGDTEVHREINFIIFVAEIVMKKIVAVFFLLSSFAATAQELRNHFTIPGRIENNIHFNFWQNPALTGYEERFNVQGGYGMRWLGLYGYNNSSSPQNWFTAVDVAMGKSKNNSIGFVYNHNRNAFEKRTEFMFSYSATFRIRKVNQIRIGLSTSYNLKFADWKQMTFGDQIDPRAGFIFGTNQTLGSNRRGFPDFSAGLWFSRKHLFLGFSAQHLTQPDEGWFGVSKLPMLLNYNAGYHIRITPYVYLTPSLIVMNRRNIYYFQPSLSLSYKNRYLVLLNYRNLNTLMIYGGIQLKENLRLTFGWGFPTEKELRAIQSGQSFDVMLRYRFKMRKDPTPEEQMKITKP